ncbi:Interferon-induced very large GTPase 1 [Anabarilius grahami]|uniref:Interferon-induced very large GTPase 1 n=1 Tax=Anabarilius grahami TaxID=495550 RepID=A0A3N0YUT4_ANAGA|nr:Interferon-induced very large GTPase 1 [Anabarilius grahami]
MCNQNIECYQEIAENLRDVLDRFIPYLHTANLVGTAGMASDLDSNVDEDEICRMAFGEVEEVLSGIEDGMTSYLENQLPLQGVVWKQLCQLEKEEGRHQQHTTQSLRGEKENLIKQLLDYKLTTAMRAFDTTKRAFFLSWMRVKLEVAQLDKLSHLRGTNEEWMQEPCIGLEHFLREMVLVYERYFSGPKSDLYDMFRLPYVGAELLLYGVPLELYDGDASVFPMNWVYSVLYEVYKQLPKFSRMRVLKILGFHNSKNAEILSAMFGTNFLKWGMRHIKGAYVLLLSLPGNLRMEMDCEFLMLIDTEGTPPRNTGNLSKDDGAAKEKPKQSWSKNARLRNASQLNGFKVKTSHFALNSKSKKTLKYNKNVAQRFTNNLIEDCDKRVSEKLKHKECYSDSYMRELLAILDKGLEVLKGESFMMNPKFEAGIKGYICSKALVSFQEVQQLLIRERETKERFLNETKDRHILNFIYQFRKRHQCQKAAQSFINLCFKPTAEDFIYSSLERQIFDDMLQNKNARLYSSPKKFHYGLLKEMLLKDSFENFHEYLQSDESFSQKSIENFIRAHLSGSVMIEDRREQRMHQIFDWVKRCIKQASESSSGAQSNVRLLLEKVCISLESLGKMTMPTQILEEPLFDISTHREYFLADLQESVSVLSSIAQEFMENEDVIEVPDDLPNKLEDMLYDRVKRCDKRCPFCKAPCDLEEKEHKVHEAVVHRPKGLVCYTNANSTTLSHNTCSADIVGQN